MSMPQLRVEYRSLGEDRVDLLQTTGTMDFDGGTLIVWRDERRNHLLAAYGPSSGWVVSWEDADG